ncbi:MAG: hypothetical protein IPK18_13940 [Sphingobacteriales bacterium]|nr:MAG: hypothetical protein IPK18_13940 [Sphingobacteriales bacterium]
MKTIKKITLIALFICTIFAISCKKDNNGNTGKTGIYTIDDVTYNGNTSVQTFSNGNYSILCEQKSPYKLLQFVFHSKEEAEAGGEFTVIKNSIATISNVPSGKVLIGTDYILLSKPVNSNYKIVVNGNKILINSNIKLLDLDDDTNDNTTINSADINF